MTLLGDPTLISMNNDLNKN